MLEKIQAAPKGGVDGRSSCLCRQLGEISDPICTGLQVLPVFPEGAL